MKNSYCGAVVIFILAIFSCNLLCEKPLTIESWSPGPGIHRAEGIEAGILFSVLPDKARAENAFILEADGETVPGVFTWEDRWMKFIPFGGFKDNCDYKIFIDRNLRTENGLSLDDAFEGCWTTRQDASRPVLVSVLPADNSCIEDYMSQVILDFSKALDIRYFRSNIAISPSSDGIWQLSDDSRRVTFTPWQPYQHDTRYTITINPGLIDMDGNRTGIQSCFSFQTGKDTTRPKLISAFAIDSEERVKLFLEADLIDDSSFTQNHLWEAGYRLLLEFNMDVRISGLAGRVLSEGGSTLKQESTEEFSRYAVFSFTEPPLYGTEFKIRIKPGIEDQNGNSSREEHLFHILADGPGSKPPYFLGVRFLLPQLPEDEGSATESFLALFSRDRPFEYLPLDVGVFPPGITVKADFEIYFDLADGAEPDRISLMECLRVHSENSALDYSLDRILVGGFAGIEACDEWPDASIATVEGRITNRASSGLFFISLAGGLRDSNGNKTLEAQKLPIIK